MSNQTISIIINSESSLNDFAHKTAKHMKMTPSALKHAVSKGQGCSHTSVLIDAFPKQQVEATETKSDFKPGRTIATYLETNHTDDDKMEWIQDLLDESIFRFFGDEASDINNGGIESQVNALHGQDRMSEVWDAFNQEEVDSLPCRMQIMEDMNRHNAETKSSSESETPLATIEEMTANPQELVHKYLGIDSDEDLSDSAVDKVEENFMDIAKEMTWAPAELDKAIALLSSNGCTTTASLLQKLALAEAKLTYCHTNAYQ